MGSNDEILTVGFLRNYDYPDLLRQSQDFKGKWNQLQFIDLEKNPQKKVDILIVFNHPKEDISIKVRKGGKILMIQEPPYEQNNYLNLTFKYFDLILSAFSKEATQNISIPAGLPWHINKSYQELIELNANPENKLDRVSWITSSLSRFSGHKIRLQFVDFLKDHNFDFDLFGRGFNPIDDKFDGIFPYKYSIAAENYIADDYFTEKIMDVFLCEAMPLYYGCQNIDKYFPKGSYVQLDLERPQWSLDKIKDVLNSNIYSTNREAIKEAKDLVLNKYQFLPLTEQLLNDQINLGKEYKSLRMRKNGASFLSSLRSKLKR